MREQINTFHSLHHFIIWLQSGNASKVNVNSGGIGERKISIDVTLPNTYFVKLTAKVYGYYP